MSEMHLQATVGADRSNPAAGTSLAVRRGPEGGLLTSPITARYQQAVLGGNVFGVANQVGVASQTTLSATTPVLTLANPLGSGVNAVVWFVGAGMSVGNAAAAPMLVAVNTNTAAAAVTGTATTTHRNMLLGGNGTPKCKSFLAATPPAAPVSIGTLGIGLTGAITTSTTAPFYGRWYDGALILGPNTALSVQTLTASGALGLWCEYIWEEFPV